MVVATAATNRDTASAAGSVSGLVGMIVRIKFLRLVGMIVRPVFPLMLVIVQVGVARMGMLVSMLVLMLMLVNVLVFMRVLGPVMLMLMLMSMCVFMLVFVGMLVLAFHPALQETFAPTVHITASRRTSCYGLAPIVC